jgi:hypothetical protein
MLLLVKTNWTSSKLEDTILAKIFIFICCSIFKSYYFSLVGVVIEGRDEEVSEHSG